MVAEASDFTRRLPPGRKDFEAYRLTTVAGLSTRQAAAQMGLSQTRVVQLRDRVLDWMAAELPRLETAPPEQRLVVAEYLAVERMEFLYGASLSAWRQSQGPETVERKSAATGDVSTIVRTSQGNIRYLQQAMRIAKEMGKFPMRPLMTAAAECGDDESDDSGDSADDFPVAHEANPLEEDCSADSPLKLRVSGNGDASNAASRSGSRTYGNVFHESEAAIVPLARENNPVHQAGIGSADGSNPDASAAPLNRHERRARQRRLEKALKRKAK